MPSRVKTFCINGCKGKGFNNSRLCKKCFESRETARAEYFKLRERERTKRVGNISQRGYDGQWAKVSRLVRRSEPICRMCKLHVSELVDHIIPLKEGGDRLALDNLQPLCRKCHAAKTAADYAKQGK